MNGIIAILRGITPDEVLDVAAALLDGGIGVIEVPLNSPQAFDSLSRLVAAFGSRALIGAGTVLTLDDVDRVAATGARLVLSPNLDTAVVQRTRSSGLLAMPGVATPSEGFQALAAGADALKLFPAELLGPPVLKAWRAVFPPATAMVAVGGVGEYNLAAFRAAGAVGAGVGSSLYAPGTPAAEVARRARRLVDIWQGTTSC